MVVDPTHWTEKVHNAWQASQAQAKNEGHAQLTPLHVAVVILEDRTGIAKQVCNHWIVDSHFNEHS